MVQLTFPVTWLNTPDVSDNEAIVMLRVPKKMLELDDTNSDSGMITVSYPETMFEGFSNLNEKDVTLQERQKASGINLQHSGNQSALNLQKNQKPGRDKEH